MFIYVNNVNNLVHDIIKNKFKNGNIAIDATLGNGQDSDFLSGIFNKVYSFDIQEEAVKRYEVKSKENVIPILDSHENFSKYIKEEVDCIVYNLGYLPGANKNITTKAQSTIISINEGLKLLGKNGLMFIAIYSGHQEGSIEKDVIIKLAKSLPTDKFGVLYSDFINRPNNPPSLIVIEKI